MRKNKDDVDELDIQILAALVEMGNISNKALAKKVNAHQNTVMQRVRKLEDAKVIRKYTVDVDYEKLGMSTRAIVFIRAKGGRVGDRAQLEAIAKIPQVRELHATTGGFDLVCHIMVKTREELAEVLRKIQDHGNIARTNSQIVLYTYKDSEQFNPL